MSYISILELFIAVVIIVVMIYLLIKKKSSSTVSLIWIAIALVMLIQAIFPQILTTLCRIIGIEYPPALAFLTAIAGLIIITFYISSELTVSQNKIRELTIHISLLNDEMHLLKTERAREIERKNNEVQSGDNEGKLPPG